MKTWSELNTLQPIVTKMLTNGIEKERIAHAYLFQGSRGTGKKEASILVAKSFFCPNQTEVEPCHVCRECKRIDSGNHPDLHWVKPDGASIKKEQIAHLQKEFTYTGLESNQKVYIIEHADRMTTNASNQLLKFLEEPSKNTVAILLTENNQSILNTIRSRCQIMSFKPLNPIALQQKLVENGVTEATARLTSYLTNNVSEAIELSHDGWFAKSREIVIKLIEVLHEQKDEAFLFLHNQWLNHFQDREQTQLGLDLLLIWYKDFIYYHIERQEAIIFMNEIDRFEKYTYTLSQKFATKAIKNILEAKSKLMANVNPTLVIEDLVLHLQR
ncbi:DNA polymerase-3 subunit delta' [Salirhabdus euzebyi]|uniref:DNA polymerase-3 subunit delta n=1 Tax=Salirhabdus euzebyi TaxID=394506 RepID=A0A841QA26_9BACI|nr:DNA polymerase III subunit delta' [Salirhabdus euzebyi]MBB6455225.1 DNA polymerase-3 subunit delta' [Salirhabdus euzebyi]